jgi:hypothetical protein
MTVEGRIFTNCCPMQAVGRNRTFSSADPEGVVSSEPQPFPECHEPAPKSHKVTGVDPEM